MIRRVGASGLTLMLASSALALGVLTIGGPFANDVEWLTDQASFTPVVLEPPAMRLPTVEAGKNLTLASVSLARPAAIRINPPTVAVTDLGDASIQPAAFEAPEMALLDIPSTGAGALTLVARVAIQPPASGADAEGGGIRLAALGAFEAALPAVPVTEVGALAAVSGIVIQPPFTRSLERGFEEGFAAIQLQPIQAGLDPVEAPAKAGLLCLGDCVSGQEFETCDKIGGAT